MALRRVAIPSPNYSSRGGAKVRLIILHTAEGALTYQSLGSFFQSRSSQVSSHVGIDDTPNTVGEYVRPDAKAWTSAGANPVAVQAELCAFAHRWSAAEWDRHPNMLANCAAWIAEEAKRFGIPIVKLTPAQARGSGRGVCQHRDLGSWGGGHSDCGDGFPIDRVLQMARGGAPVAPEGGFELADPPGWFWKWLDWYLTTERKPGSRPKGTPQTIPKWAWDAQKQVEQLATRFGMTAGERDWIVWNLGGKKGKRPDVPQTIPDRWWNDQAFTAQQRGKG